MTYSAQSNTSKRTRVHQSFLNFLGEHHAVADITISI